MLIVLFILFLILIVLGLWLISECCEDGGILACLVGVIANLIIIGCAIMCCIGLSKTKVIDEKIAMYTEENAKIEEQIDTVVKEYMEYEGETFTELKGDSSITLVSLYPDLKSDELVKTQIATYQANNQKIKELKETKINAKVYKWWLYFGK